MALKDINTTPTEGMREEARKGLEWRKKYGRGGTQTGVSRARDIINGNLSISSIKRMFSFFSRHENNKAEHYSAKESDSGPTAWRIAWALWGGDAGFSWSKTKRDQIMRERAKSDDDFEYIEEACIDVKRYHDDDEEEETKAPLSASVRKGLQGKVDKHNEKYGDKKGKRVTLRMLGAVFRRVLVHIELIQARSDQVLEQEVERTDGHMLELMLFSCS